LSRRVGEAFARRIGGDPDLDETLYYCNDANMNVTALAGRILAAKDVERPKMGKRPELSNYHNYLKAQVEVARQETCTLIGEAMAKAMIDLKERRK
jgi:hypothetical protein